MPAALVAANLRSRLALFAEQSVDQCRLPHPAGTEEGHRAARSKRPAQLVEPVRRSAARHQNGDAQGDLLEFPSGRFWILDEVTLGEHDHRLGTAVEGQHELAFQTPLVRRHGKGVTQEDDVDVGGHGVGDCPCSLERRPTHERRAALENVLDSFPVARRHDPVTDGYVGADVADPIGAGAPWNGSSSVLQPRSMRVTRAGDPGEPSASHADCEVGPPTESVGH